MPPRGRKRKQLSDDGDDSATYVGNGLSTGSGIGDDAALTAAVSALSSVFPFASPPPAAAAAPATITTTATSAGAFVKRSQLSAREKLAVIEWYHANGKNQQATAAHFKALPGYEKLSQSTVSRWVAGEAKIRELVDTGRADVVRLNSVRNPNFENVLKEWLERIDGDDVTHLTGDLIKQTAAKVYDHMQIPAEQRLELSNGWLRSFQVRHGIKLGKSRRSVVSESPSRSSALLAHALIAAPSPARSPARAERLPADNDQSLEASAEAHATGVIPSTAATRSPQVSRQFSSSPQIPKCAATPPQESRRVIPSPLPSFRRVLPTVPDAVIKREQERIATSIREFLSWDHKRSLSDVWNFDEISLCYACSPILNDSATEEETEALRKQSFTVALATNAKGTERRAPLIIGKTERPNSFKKGRTGSQLGFQYLHNRGAWLTAEIFYAWLDLWNTELAAQNRHVLLLVDSYSGHKLGNKEFSNIQLEYFSPRVTEIVQPFCDAAGGIARAFKACFRRLAVLRATDRLLSDAAFAKQESIFAIDQLAAMELVIRAWPQVQTETIWSCWRNAKILPMDQSSSRTDVRPADIALPELQTLQDAILVLKEEARMKGFWLDMMNSPAFVAADANDAAGNDGRLEEIVQFTIGGMQDRISAGADGTASGGRGADGNLVSGILNGVEESGADRNDATAIDAAAADTDVGAADLNPVHVYKSLLVLEQYWRENAMLLTDNVRELLQATRNSLQADINEARQQQQQQQQQPRVQQASQNARSRRK